ncbi:MAG: hypothetical protein EOP06_20585 [Proteobacteria bacterium]|nr:MAG: hypothetical protein EOP06_20585 [Pseudomonadota bacterium]
MSVVKITMLPLLRWTLARDQWLTRSEREMALKAISNGKLSERDWIDIGAYSRDMMSSFNPARYILRKRYRDFCEATLGDYYPLEVVE